LATHSLGASAITALCFAKEEVALAAGTQSGQVTMVALET